MADTAVWVLTGVVTTGLVGTGIYMWRKSAMASAKALEAAKAAELNRQAQIAKAAQDAARRNQGVQGGVDALSTLISGIGVTMSGVLSDDRVQGTLRDLTATGASAGKEAALGAIQGLAS